MSRKHGSSATKAAATSPSAGGSRVHPHRAAVPHHPTKTSPVDVGRRDALFGSVMLLLVAGVHLGWRVEPVLRYELTGPPFFVDAPFFHKSTSAPGGLLGYLAAGLAQFNARNWLGTAAFTLLLGGILLCARRVFARVGATGTTGMACGLVALLVALPGRYESALEGTAVGLLAALGATCLWLAVPPRWSGVQLISCWAITAVVFLVAGTLPAALCLTLVVLDALLVRRQRGLALGCSLALVLVPLWTWHQPGFSPFAAVHDWGDGLTRALHVLIYLFVPAGFAGHATLARRVDHWNRGQTPRFLGALGFLAALGLLWGSLDTSRKTLAQLEQAANRQDWARVSTAARSLSTWAESAQGWPPQARLQLMRALHHAGRLPEDLFTFPQRRGLDLVPDYDEGLAMARAEAHVLLELGQVNLAEHMAHESLELDGPRPDTLRLLARINILKGRPEAARVFLNRLRLAPFHRREAEHELQLLAADPGGTNQPTLNLIRSRLVRTDEPDSRLPTEALLLQLLRANPTNRMALDYLLTHRLLNTEFENLVADLDRLGAFGDAVLPRPCEEALLFYRDRAPERPLNLRGRSIRPATIERYGHFTAVAQQYHGQPATARAALATEFGDTFWFYLLFGETAQVLGAPTHPPQP